LKEIVSPFTRRRRPLLQSWGLLLGIALFLGVVSQLARPNPLPWTADREQRLAALARASGLLPVEAEEALDLVRRGEVLVFDARPPAEFANDHLPGAFSMPNATREESYAVFAAALPSTQAVLVYCGGVDCGAAIELGRFLRGQGHERVFLLTGGLTAWKSIEGMGR